MNKFPWHPFLFAIFFVLFLYAHNADEVLFADTLSSFLAVLMGTVAILGIFRLIYRDNKKAALIATLFVILFFSYGHLFELRGTDYWTRHRYLLTSYAFIFLSGAALILRAKAGFMSLTKLLNFIAIVLILGPVYTLSAFEYRAWQASRGDIGPIGTPEIVREVIGPKPDIYLIMLDAYASSHSLMEFYDYDNSKFINFLVEKDFYVVSKPASNHSGTALSLTTLLNINHLEQISSTGELTLEALQPRNSVQDNVVGRFLKSEGYTYIQMGSTWEGTFHNSYADVNINTGVLKQFPLLIYEKTAIYPYTFNYSVFDTDKVQWRRVRMQFKALKNIPDEYDSPVFVFAHIGIPRGPFVFNEDGSYKISEPIINEPEREELGLKGEYHLRGYLDQIKYTNSEVMEIIEAILEKSPNPPIIIVQSDHGSRISVKKRLEKEANVSDLYVRDRMRNFNAMYLPDGGTSALYDTITPVNTFRIIFDRYFGTELGLVSDRSFVALPRPGNTNEYDDREEHYNFVEVTDRLQYD
jgi:hypothetical protein